MCKFVLRWRRGGHWEGSGLGNFRPFYFSLLSRDISVCKMQYCVSLATDRNISIEVLNDLKLYVVGCIVRFIILFNDIKYLIKLSRVGTTIK